MVFKGMLVGIGSAGTTPHPPVGQPPPLFEVASVNAGNSKITLTSAWQPAAATTLPSPAASGPPPELEGTLYAYDAAVYTANTGGKSSISSHAAQQKIRAGDPSTWDLTLLLFALLNSAHQLVAPADNGSLAGALADLRQLRNEAHGHADKCALSADEFTTAIARLRKRMRSIDDACAARFEAVITDVLASPIVDGEFQCYVDRLKTLEDVVREEGDAVRGAVTASELAVTGTVHDEHAITRGTVHDEHAITRGQIIDQVTVVVATEMQALRDAVTHLKQAITDSEVGRATAKAKEYLSLLRKIKPAGADAVRFWDEDHEFEENAALDDVIMALVLGVYSITHACMECVFNHACMHGSFFGCTQYAAHYVNILQL